MESNPFRSAAVRPGAMMYQFSETSSSETQLIRLRDQLSEHRISQIVGDHGTGKSSLIQSLIAVNQEDGDSPEVVTLRAPEIDRSRSFQHWASRWRADRDNFSQAILAAQRTSIEHLLIIDGAEQLSRLRRTRFIRYCLRRAIRLLVTTHRSFRGIPTLYRTHINLGTLRDLTLERIRHSSPHVQQAIRARLENLSAESITNVREYWFDLYDVAQHAIRQTDKIPHQDLPQITQNPFSQDHSFPQDHPFPQDLKVQR